MNELVFCVAGSQEHSSIGVSEGDWQRSPFGKALWTLICPPTLVMKTSWGDAYRNSIWHSKSCFRSPCCCTARSFWPRGHVLLLCLMKFHKQDPMHEKSALHWNPKCSSVCMKFAVANCCLYTFLCDTVIDFCACDIYHTYPFSTHTTSMPWAWCSSSSVCPPWDYPAVTMLHESATPK